jgi:hypothetical protein
MHAKMRACLAEVTEGAEGKILFDCPEEFLGTVKEALLENRPLNLVGSSLSHLVVF